MRVKHDDYEDDHYDQDDIYFHDVTTQEDALLVQCTQVDNSRHPSLFSSSIPNNRITV